MRNPPECVDTLAVHAGRGDFARLGVHAPPVDLSSTYPFGDLDGAVAALEGLARGEATAATPIYSRLHQPTVARWEEAVAALEGSAAAVAFASGMAAITAVLLAATARGRHVVAVRPLYGGTDHLLASHLLGFDVSFVRPDGVADAIRPDTALVLLETPGNPTLDLVDIAGVVRQAGGVPVAVDSTFATPVLQRPLEHGAVYAVHSATKFLSGHGDVIAGVVATGEPRAAELRQVRVATGALLHPWAAFLLHRSLPTLPMRVRRAQETAGELARRLAAHPEVTKVLYPGLPGADPRGLVGRQMSGPGAILAFEVAGGFAAAQAVLAACRLITPAVSLGSTDTLIEHPAGLTHRLVDERARQATGITPGLLRLAVGLEGADDLWRDLDGALAAGARAADRIAGALATPH
jgi:cystathionine beta-lyase/cystathionine gamma-synthase